ncbi:MAG: GNAT family N-acetyltransferase [Firmicutes bacterium]|jgi:RimJ/RimL family protein N-acetyltransferase|nr:GNAT family N-acetyltransferase [Bacillota bacterium]
MVTNGIYIRKLKRRDLSQLLKWGSHDDLLFEPYNFPKYDRFELLSWYFEKRSPLKKRIFGIFLDKELVGFLTLKNINYLKRRAEMGIVMNPSLVSRGFGTKAIKLLFDYVRRKTYLKTIWLKTASFNYRAIRSYDKCGFEIKERIHIPYESQNNKYQLISEYDYFTIIDGDIYTHYVIMEREV